MEDKLDKLDKLENLSFQVPYIQNTYQNIIYHAISEQNNNFTIALFGLLSIYATEDLFQQSTIYGFESDEALIQPFKQCYPNSIISSLDKLSELDIHYDIIILNNLQNVKNTPIFAYLKPGGLFILNTRFRDDSRELKSLLPYLKDYYFISQKYITENVPIYELFDIIKYNNREIFLAVNPGAEPIVNLRKKITIITPSYRIDNLKKIKEHINFDYVNEWIIVYDGNKVAENPKLFDHAKIKEYILKDETGHWGNLQRNYALDNISITDTYLYFLDDDNIIHPNLYRLLDIIENNRLYTFNIENIDKTIKTKGDIIIIGKIDTGNILIDYNLCKDIRWDNACNPKDNMGPGYQADGYYICNCYKKNKDKWIYIDNIFGYYNNLV